MLNRQFSPLRPRAFKCKDLAPVSAHCGCALIRQVQTHKRHSTRQGTRKITYDCRVCDSAKPNRQERVMLDMIKTELHNRGEKFVLCVEVPLPQRRSCDVLVVPLVAARASQLLAIELDGCSHVHNPWRKGMSSTAAFNNAVNSDNIKNSILDQKGVSRLRLCHFQLDSDPDRWKRALHQKLDSLT